jgi:hypothetical protein
VRTSFLKGRPPIAIEVSNSSEICENEKSILVKPFKLTNESIKYELMMLLLPPDLHLMDRDLKVCRLSWIAEAIP